MCIAPAITLSPAQRTVSESQARSRSLTERARIVLFAASGLQDKCQIEIGVTVHRVETKVDIGGRNAMVQAANRCRAKNRLRYVGPLCLQGCQNRV
jgi:hypothetical protein